MHATSRGLLIVAVLALLASPSEARADSVIKNPDAHPVYRAELEPHGDLVFWHRRFGRYRGHYGGGFGDPEFGAGFRASIEVGDPAFVPPINNTVGISFGIDVTTCNCSFYDAQIYFPVALQWNFWFTENWSAFAEGGAVLPRTVDFEEADVDFYVAAGGRYAFNEDIALVMRIGYPISFTIGPSFFVGE